MLRLLLALILLLLGVIAQLYASFLVLNSGGGHSRFNPHEHEKGIVMRITHYRETPLHLFYFRSERRETANDSNAGSGGTFPLAGIPYGLYKVLVFGGDSLFLCSAACALLAGVGLRHSAKSSLSVKYMAR